MENVGMVTYRDQFIRRDEEYTDMRTAYILMVFLHEISHMWFGNCVTMKWWDDLWLNESFANLIAFVCLDEAPGLEQFTNAWSVYLGDYFWGLETDAAVSTHPIATNVIHTEQARSIFDGISYGKGGNWLRQTMHLFGREAFKKAVSSYFKEFAYKNTTLEDFINKYDQAVKELGIERDFKSWAQTWLHTAGCNSIWHTVQ